jgi:hypothetical protein
MGGAASGCSLAFVDGPPPLQLRRPHFDCSSTYAMPALDTGIALLGFTSLLARSSSALPTGDFGQDKGRLLELGSTFIFGISAVDGYQQVHACREAREDAEPPPETLHQHRPPPSRPPPVGATPPSSPPVPQQPDPSDAP